MKICIFNVLKIEVYNFFKEIFIILNPSREKLITKIDTLNFQGDIITFVPQ